MSATPFWELDASDPDLSTDTREAAYLLQKIDGLGGGLAGFLKWGGSWAFPDSDLQYLAIDAAEAMKALDDGLTAWALERGVSR